MLVTFRNKILRLYFHPDITKKQWNSLIGLTISLNPSNSLLCWWNKTVVRNLLDLVFLVNLVYSTLLRHVFWDYRKRFPTSVWSNLFRSDSSLNYLTSEMWSVTDTPKKLKHNDGVHQRNEAFAGLHCPIKSNPCSALTCDFGPYQ